jgi:mono/diheme cytochrome c family protein
MSRVIVISALALLAGLAGFAGLAGCAGVATTTAPTATTAAAVFARNCERCHGADRRGQIGPNITAGALQSRGRTDEYLRDTITNGVRNMPTWKGKLSPEQIEAIIKFLRS